jgi:hypothetical protein
MLSDRLQAGRPGSIPGRGKIFFSLHSAQAGSGAHPASYQMDSGGDLPGEERLGSGADDAYRTSAEAMNGGGDITPLLRRSSWSYA